MRRAYEAILVAVVAFSLAALAGCGDDSDDGSDTQATPTDVSGGDAATIPDGRQPPPGDTAADAPSPADTATDTAPPSDADSQAPDGADGSGDTQTSVGPPPCTDAPVAVDDLTEEEAAAQLALLVEAYDEQSAEKLEAFLEHWRLTIRPISCDAFDGLSDAEREAYYLFRDYYDPLHVLQYGDNEWGTEIYEGLQWLVVQYEIYEITTVPFRPALSFDTANVLYFTPRYEFLLDTFLSDPATADARLTYLNSMLHILHGHWGGWLFVIHPQVFGIEFSGNMLGATVHFRIVYQGGESIMVKQDGLWVMVSSYFTWIE